MMTRRTARPVYAGYLTGNQERNTDPRLRGRNAPDGRGEERSGKIVMKTDKHKIRNLILAITFFMIVAILAASIIKTNVYNP